MLLHFAGGRPFQGEVESGVHVQGPESEEAYGKAQTGPHVISCYTFPKDVNAPSILFLLQNRFLRFEGIIKAHNNKTKHALTKYRPTKI